MFDFLTRCWARGWARFTERCRPLRTTTTSDSNPWDLFCASVLCNANDNDDDIILATISLNENNDDLELVQVVEVDDSSFRLRHLYHVRDNGTTSYLEDLSMQYETTHPLCHLLRLYPVYPVHDKHARGIIQRNNRALTRPNGANTEFEESDDAEWDGGNDDYGEDPALRTVK